MATKTIPPGLHERGGRLGFIVGDRQDLRVEARVEFFNLRADMQGLRGRIDLVR